MPAAATVCWHHITSSQQIFRSAGYRPALYKLASDKRTDAAHVGWRYLLFYKKPPTASTFRREA